MIKVSEPKEDKSAASKPAETEAAADAEVPHCSWAEFLSSKPPDSFDKIKDVAVDIGSSGVHVWRVSKPEIEIFCEECDGVRRFICEVEDFGQINKLRTWYHGYADYLCKNCESIKKLFALMVYRSENREGAAIKLEEWPPFEQARTPRRLRKILGEEDWSYFWKGQKSENNALGLGAFTYYRRVLDRQWDQLLAEIVKVAKATRADPEIVARLKEAQEEKFFERSLERAKEAIPPVLLRDGHNPLLALHKALSVHIHEKDDGECLQLAHDVQVVLGDLAEHIGEILKSETHVQQALGRLQRVKQDG